MDLRYESTGTQFPDMIPTTLFLIQNVTAKTFGIQNFEAGGLFNKIYFNNCFPLILTRSFLFSQIKSQHTASMLAIFMLYNCQIF
jgi:hypothetical protein